MVELADTRDLGSRASGVGVQVPLLAPDIRHPSMEYSDRRVFFYKPDHTAVWTLWL